MGDIDTQINSISTAVDLSSFKVLTPEMNTALNDFKNSGISSIDFAAINTTVQETLLYISKYILPLFIYLELLLEEFIVTVTFLYTVSLISTN